MTRTEAAHSVRERWQRLGIGTPEEFPHVFSSDVDNMLEESSTGNILDVADRATGNAPVTDGFQVGDEGVGGGNDAGLEANLGASVRRESSPADSQTLTPLYLLASEIVDIVTKDMGNEDQD